MTLPGPGGRVLSLACLLLVFAAYFTWLWSGGRRTLPMRTWRLEFATRGGATLDIRRAALRYAAWWIGPLCALGADVALRTTGQGRWAVVLLGFNYAWALVDRDRQFLHDRIAGTLLLRRSVRDHHPAPAHADGQDL